MTMTQSGRPEHGALTRRVWEIADEMLADRGTIPRGREVVDAYLREDPSRKEGTAFTQYSHWKKAHEAAGAAPRAQPHPGADDVPDAGEVMRFDVAADGTLRLPRGVMRGLDLPEGGVLSGRLVDGQLILVEPLVALRRVQKIARKYKVEGESVVDSFLAGRRSMWGEG
ncbi:MAG: hypothetical protein H5U20_10665 [Rhodobacteraceae bacterium]|nr:hypothetical protein [Paracoccaceae bacterium]